MNTLAAEISVPERQVSKWIKICFTLGGTRSSPPNPSSAFFYPTASGWAIQKVIIKLTHLKKHASVL